MESDEGVMVNKLRRLSIQSPSQNNVGDSSLILSEEDVNSIIAVCTSSPLAATPIQTSTSIPTTTTTFVTTTTRRSDFRFLLKTHTLHGGQTTC